MKKTRRLALFALSFTLVCSLILGSAGIVNNGVSASDDGTVQTISLFSLEKDNVNCAGLAQGTYREKTGIYAGPGYSDSAIKADYDNWHVDFAYAFSGDFSIEYSLINPSGNKGFVEYTFADLSGNDVIRVGLIQWSAAIDGAKIAGLAYVYDVENETYYTLDANGNQINSKTNSDKFTNSLPYGSFGFYPYVDLTTTDAINTGELSLVWNGNAVEVKLTRLVKPNSADNLETSLQTVATINSATELKDGYKVSVGVRKAQEAMWSGMQGASTSCVNKNVSAVGALILSINGLSMANETITLGNKVISDAVYTGTADNNVIVIEQGENILPFKKTIKQNITTGWFIQTEETVQVEDYSTKSVGTYSLAVGDKNFTVKVLAAVGGLVKGSGLFTLEKDASGYAVLQHGEYRGKTGVYAGPEYAKADWKDWNVTFANTFSGDFEMEYSLPNVYGGVIGFIEFVFSDLKGNPVIKVGLEKWGHADSDGAKIASLAYVYDVENSTYYSIKNDGTNINSNDNADCFGSDRQTGKCYGFYPYATPNAAGDTEKANLSTGKIVLTWNDNAVDVKLTRLEKPGDEGSAVSLQTVATINSATKLKDGYKVSVGRCKTTTQMWSNNVGDTGNVCDQAALILSVNGVSFATENVKTNVNVTSFEYSGTTNEDGSIDVAKGENLKPFTVKGTQSIGGWNLGTDYEDTINADAMSDKEVGTYQVTVNFGKNYSKTFTVNVIDSNSALVANTALTIREGASVYVKDSSNGIRFQMSILVSDYTALISAGTTTFGMIIMPADYLVTCGDLTVDNLFGENAIYGWGENTSGKVPVICQTYSELAFNSTVLTDDYYMNISIKDILEDNINRKFVAAGFVKCTINGVDYYRIATYKDNDITNSQRSMYEVAKAAYNATNSSLGDTQKETLKTNYIDVIDGNTSVYSTYKVEYYKVENGTATLADSVEISAKVGTAVGIPVISDNPVKTYAGYVYDSEYSGTCLSGTVASDGALTLKVYYMIAE